MRKKEKKKVKKKKTGEGWFVCLFLLSFCFPDESCREMTAPKPMDKKDWDEFFTLISEDTSDQKVWTVCVDEEELKVWKRPVRFFFFFFFFGPCFFCLSLAAKLACSSMWSES